MKHTTTYCKFSGVALARTPKLFTRESCSHYSKHWIFDASWHELQKYQYQHTGSSYSLTNEQRSLLSLAMMLHPEALGTKITLDYPVLFDQVLLQRNFGQVVYVTDILAGLPPTRRNKVLENLPKFTSAAISTFATQEHSLAVGKQLLNFVCSTIAQELYTNLDLEPSSEESIRAAMLELDGDNYRAAKKKQELVDQLIGTSTENLKVQQKYWNFILQDIEITYSIPKESISKFKKEIVKPTDKKLLETLRSLVIGLKEATKIDGKSTIPSLQLSFAAGDLSDKINELERRNTELDLSLPELPITLTGNLPKDANVTITPVTEPEEPTRTMGRLEALRTKMQKDKETSKQKTADFILNFTNKD